MREAGASIAMMNAHSGWSLLAAAGGTRLQWQDSAVILLYLVGILALGAYFKWRELKDSVDDYLLGSRGLPWWLIAVASFMTLISTSSLVSIPGEAYNHGVGLAFRSIIGPLLGIPIFYLCIRFFFRARVYTPFAYLEQRFDRRVRAWGSVAYLIIRLFYLALTLFAAAKVLEGVAGWSILQSVLIVGLVGLVYVYLGGMKAVVWADFFQFIILVGGLLLVAATCMQATGLGPWEVWNHAVEHGRGLELQTDERGLFSFSPFARVSMVLIVLSALTDRLFYLSADQMAVQRFLSAKSYQQAARSNMVSMLMQIPIMLLVWFVGLAVFGYYGLMMPPEVRPEGDTALFQFVATQLPVFGGGLFIAACLGAIMSTLDGGFHSLATVYVKDVHLMFVNPKASEARQVQLSRLAIFCIAMATMGGALFIGYTSPVLASSFMETQVFWIAFQGILAMWFLIGVLSTRATARDIFRAFALAGVVTLISVGWYIYSRGTDQPVSFLFVSVPGELTMLVAGLLPSLWRRRQSSDKIKGLTLFTLDSTKGGE